jgi:hypothetical protein
MTSTADPELIDEILRAVGDVRGTNGENAVWIRPYVPQCDGDHQFVIFFKPEIMADAGIRLERVLAMFIQIAAESAVSLHAVRLIGWRYLEQHNLIASHYGVINRISRHGRNAISRIAEKELNKQFKAELEQGAEVIGGHQLLQQYARLSSSELLRLNDDGVSKRLATGTYGLALTMDDRPFIVLNAFHPCQLDRFVKEPNVLLIFEGRSKMPWSTLRQRFAGSTDPMEAHSGSIRRELWRHQRELGIGPVTRASNGFHVSAGPLEGMVELRLFCDNPTASSHLSFVETCFGKALFSSGLSLETIEQFAANPRLMVGGEMVSAFDVTEEMNAKEAAQALATATWPKS